MSIALFFQEMTNYTWPIVLLIGTLLTVCTAVAAFLITRTIYKTTLPSRLAETYRANYEAERARADLTDRELKKLQEEKKTWELEKASLTSDYSQLTQLYGAKSIILERITGIYGNLAQIAETGTVHEFLEAIRHPLKLGEDTEGIHRTKG